MRIWPVATFGTQFVDFAAPIDVSPQDNPWNEPEPDLIVPKRESHSYHSNPQPQDLALVVEVADSTLKFDLTVKARLYARAEIAEYGVLDIAGKRLIAHRSPISGAYSSVEVYEENETVAPLAAPTARFTAAEM